MQTKLRSNGRDKKERDTEILNQRHNKERDVTSSADESRHAVDLRLNQRLGVTYRRDDERDGRVHLFQVPHRLFVLTLRVELDLKHAPTAVVCNGHNQLNSP